MIGYALWLIGRLAVIGFAVLTWVYCVTTYSPFAFDMFVRPRLFMWLETFVNWHHAFYAAAYAVSILTLLPDLLGNRARTNRQAQIAAAGFAITFFGIGVWLVMSPYLPLLSTTTRGGATAFVALVPLIWLAVIDVLAGRSSLRDAIPGSRTLALATVGAAVTLAGFHFVYALLDEPGLRSGGRAMISGLWSFAFDLTAYSILFALLFLVAAIARLSPRPAGWSFALHIALLAFGIEEFCRRLVFPSLAFADRDALPIAIAFGTTASAAFWSMWLRSPAWTSKALTLAALFGTMAAGLAAVDRIEPFDWDFLGLKSIALVEGLLVFALIRKLVDRGQPAALDLRPVLLVPATALALLFLTVNATSSAEVVRTQYALADPSFRLASDGLIAHGSRDTSFATEVKAAAERSLVPLPSVPEIALTAGPPAAARFRPHIFLFVIDGLRRDYLSPYNNAVSFTPSFGEWAQDALVFQNAFTKYGGTWLAMPSIWTGLPVRRSWSRSGFDRLNSLEKLITGNNYQFIINDFTVEGHLRPDTRRTFIDPHIKSIDTDICSNVDAIRQLVTSSTPSFTFLAPMNVYTLNASRSPIVNGFSSGYAENVRRADRCFGEFVEHLKRTGIYDNSIIVITSDHGESLGENGNYGHQFFLFPEDIRIPLMMSMPRSMRDTWSTDLGRIAFSADIVPTLYQLLGYDVRDHGPLAGASLVTTAGNELPSRRRESYLVMSSYGASFGMLRRNGKLLYISDLINYREYAFELLTQPLGLPVPVTDDLRSINQSLIRTHLAAVDAFFGIR